VPPEKVAVPPPPAAPGAPVAERPSPLLLPTTPTALGAPLPELVTGDEAGAAFAPVPVVVAV
jgi:hypothetical protein